MGLFFKRQDLVPTDNVEAMLTDAYQADAVNAATAGDTAKQKTADATKAPTFNANAFIGAAIVFLVLLVAAFVAASLADGQSASTTHLKDLASLTQTLLTAWSAAVLGLIGGEAVGTKTS